MKKKTNLTTPSLSGVFSAVVILLGIAFSTQTITKTQLAIAIPLFLISTTVFLLFSFSKKLQPNASAGKVVAVSISFSMSSFLFLFISVFDYEFLSKVFIPFWEITLLVSVIVGVALTTLIKEKVEVYKKTLLIGCFLGFTIGAMFVIAPMPVHLNYLFDSTEPEAKSVTILDKDWDRRRKGPDSYEFEVKIDGVEYDIEVPTRDYDRYEVGDKYVIEKHNGAFGEAFFIPKK